jgi:NNP family nitrate/nitrite transporter-like MFS transporter
VLGIWADQYGGRIVYTGVMLLRRGPGTFLLSYAYDLHPVPDGRARRRHLRRLLRGRHRLCLEILPKEKQGTALGIFGAGNVGAAVTKFLAPFVMVAFGWKFVAQLLGGRRCWSPACCSGSLTKDDPDLAARRTSGTKPESFAAMMAPLVKLQVWRFSLYYFFVFGGFVALALWLPRYYVGVYGLDIVTAGLLGSGLFHPRLAVPHPRRHAVGQVSARGR